MPRERDRYQLIHLVNFKFALCIQAPMERADDGFSKSGTNPWGRCGFNNCLSNLFN